MYVHTFGNAQKMVWKATLQTDGTDYMLGR